jgi:hypothetical protein
MTDEWFSDYVFEVIIHRSKLSTFEKKILSSIIPRRRARDNRSHVHMIGGREATPVRISSDAHCCSSSDTRLVNAFEAKSVDGVCTSQSRYLS